jgi:hypothetical protein
VQVEIAAERLEISQEANEMLQAAAQPIDRPCRDHVYLAGSGVSDQPIEAGTLLSALGAGDAGVLVNTDDLPAGTGGNSLKLSPLVCGGLSVSADPDIDADALCRDRLLVLEASYISLY